MNNELQEAIDHFSKVTRYEEDSTWGTALDLVALRALKTMKWIEEMPKTDGRDIDRLAINAILKHFKEEV